MFEPTPHIFITHVCREGTKHVDPDTGIIYFKYDFGYEFGIIFPGEGKKIVAGTRNIQNHGSSSALPMMSASRTGDIEIPIRHEKSANHGRTSVVSFGATTPIEFDKKKKRYSLPTSNSHERFTPESYGKYGKYLSSGLKQHFVFR